MVESYEDSVKKEIEFPFELNEKVKAAFRNESAMRMAIELVTKALVESAAFQISNPWLVLVKEHPELQKFHNNLVYNSMTETVDIKKES
ncbi:MAG: hypothetical protein E3J70_05380 [Candidatus Heimdallarchaeota archaeon]|nr:MAG: hypothetical protein E3J70_05380 [Candidatus Heimdallarchaeota archaeon]